MASAEISRRFFLGSGAATLAGLPLTSSAQQSSPAQIAGVSVPSGQIESAIDAIDGIVAECMERSGIPGIAVSVVHDGKIALAKGYGLRKVDRSDPVTPDTVFQIASLSKPIGATVVAQQVSQGTVFWNSRMQELLPWFSLSDPKRNEMLTIGDLYSHRSGLPDHAGDDLEDLGFDRTTILEHLRLLPLSPFRASYAYTNFGLTAAAEAVATNAGSSWADLCKNVLYNPLDMSRTSSRFDDYISASDRAVPHARNGDSFAPLFQRTPDAQSPAGGVSSCANDMAKWMLMVLSNGRYGTSQVIQPEALLPAVSPQIVSNPPSSSDSRAGFYGYGFNVSIEPSGRVKLSHSGAFVMGAATCFSMIPSLNLGITVLSNAAPIGVVEAIASKFTDLAQFNRQTLDWYSGYSQLMEPFYTPRGRTVGLTAPKNVASPPNAESVLGRYSNPYFGAVEIEARGEKLELIAGPQSQSYPLAPWDGAMMTFDFVTENAPQGSRSVLTFSGLETGQSNSLEIELFGESAPARFIRT